MNDFTNGQVLGRAFETLRRNPAGFGLLALLMVALPNFVSELSGSHPATPAYMLGSDYRGASSLLVLILVFLFKAIVIAACIKAGETARPDLGPASRIAMTHILPLIGVSVLSWIAIIIGTMALIVPGIIAFCMFAAAIPVLLAEEEGVIQSLSRSRTLTDGYKGMIFLLYFLFWILQATASFIIGLMVSIGGNGDILRASTASLVAAGVALVDAAISASLYAELRIAKEGGVSDELVQVFE